MCALLLPCVRTERVPISGVEAKDLLVDGLTVRDHTGFCAGHHHHAIASLHVGRIVLHPIRVLHAPELAAGGEVKLVGVPGVGRAE